jgi:hypothetical protein
MSPSRPISDAETLSYPKRILFCLRYLVTNVRMVKDLGMYTRQTIFKLRANDSGPADPNWGIATHTWSMTKNGEDEYKIKISRSDGNGRQRLTIPISAPLALAWIERLRGVKISLLPENPDSCDGCYYTFENCDDMTRLKFSWANTPPTGAKNLDKLCQWLWSLVPDEWSDYPEPYSLIS